MPAYDFRCTECSCVSEVSRPSSDDSPIPCPQCGAPTKQVFYPVGVHFKGSGFHNTDYRRADDAGTAADSPCPAADSGSPSCAECPAAE
jgi:putative FmdB family regulatory protein